MRKSIYDSRKTLGQPVSAPWWHVRHQQLWEYTNEPKVRAHYIKHNKPSSEVPLRIKLMRPMVLDAEQKKLLVAFNKAEAAYMRHTRSRKFNYQECTRLDGIRAQARLALNNAIEKNLKAMHDTQCVAKRGCPWDGYTIFPPHTKKS